MLHYHIAIFGLVIINMTITIAHLHTPPEISAAAWMALFSDSDIGMTMTCEEVVEWAVRNGY